MTFCCVPGTTTWRVVGTAIYVQQSGEPSKAPKTGSSTSCGSQKREPNPKHDAHRRPTLTTNNQKTGDYPGRLTAGTVMNALSIHLLENQQPAQEHSQAVQQAGQRPLFQQICNTAPQVRRVLTRLNYKALERPGRTSEERVQDAVQAVMNQISDDTKTAILATLREHHAN